MGKLKLKSKHRLLCGDSTSESDVARLMDGGKADLCFTSPPYNSGNGGYKTEYSGKTKRFYHHELDDRSEDEWVVFCSEVLSRVGEVMQSDSSPVVWNVMYTAKCRSGYGKLLFCGEHGFGVKETICWDKGGGFPTASGGILSRSWELVFVLCRCDKYNTTQGKNEVRWNKWDIPKPKKQHEIHKATFSIELVNQVITDFLVGCNVLDPFMGSGTTLIACEQLNRQCYGMEIDPLYCDVIVKRWENLTGETAHLESVAPIK